MCQVTRVSGNSGVVLLSHMSHRSMESCLMMDGIISDDGWSPMIESRLTRMMDGVMSDDGWSHVSHVSWMSSCLIGAPLPSYVTHISESRLKHTIESCLTQTRTVAPQGASTRHICVCVTESVSI